ncbi:MAG TPA: hypothetical protein V6D02_11605 [Candidatus Obscuribacterales bacterium]
MMPPGGNAGRYADRWRLVKHSPAVDRQGAILNMETLPNLDGLLGLVAIAILLGGLWMLLSGMKGLGD